jgi:hypothetical protein
MLAAQFRHTGLQRLPAGSLQTFSARNWKRLVYGCAPSGGLLGIRVVSDHSDHRPAKQTF